MLTIASGVTFREFDVAPKGRYLLETPRGRFMLTAQAVALVRALDGKRSLDELGVSDAQREKVRRFVEEQLLPTGVFGEAGLPERAPRGASHYVEGVRPLVSLAASQRATFALRHLYRPVVALPLLAAALAAQAVFLARLDGHWFESLPASAYTLGALLTWASLAFHELGHGAACRAFGVSHGPMGVAVYLVFPCFYTDTSEAWRLPRARRVVVDLGGVYFQGLLAAASALLYLATGAPTWAAATLLMDLSILHNLRPYLRMDGYWVLSDVSGVPDASRRVREYLAWLVARGRTGERRPLLAELRPALRLFVLAYVAAATGLTLGLLAFLSAKLVTVVLPAYPHTLVRLLAAAPGSAACGSALVELLWHSLLLGTALLFLLSRGRRLLRWLRVRASVPAMEVA